MWSKQLDLWFTRGRACLLDDGMRMRISSIQCLVSTWDSQADMGRFPIEYRDWSREVPSSQVPGLVTSTDISTCELGSVPSIPKMGWEHSQPHSRFPNLVELLTEL